MWSFKKKIADKEIAGKDALVFDFGSLSVKILHCRYSGGGMEILGGKKLPYPPEVNILEGDMQNQTFLPMLSDAIASLTAQSAALAPTLAIVGIGGLGVEGYSSRITFRRANSKKTISSAEFDSILKRVEERAGQLISKMVDWETAASIEMALLNSEVLDISLDGYSVASPVGSAGEKLSFLIYNSYVQRALLKNLAEMAKGLRLNLITTTATMYALMRRVLEQFGRDYSALLLDIGGKTTDIGILASGRILGHLNFDAGGVSFTDSLANETHKEYAEAELLKLKFAASKLEESSMQDVREVVAANCKVYVAGVELVLKEFPGWQGLPPSVLVTGGGVLLPGISSALQSAEWDKSGLITDTYRVDTLLPKDFRGFRDSTNMLNSAADVPALALALDAVDLVEDAGVASGFWSNFSKNKRN